MKKKISLVLLCGVILLGICGCGKKEISLTEEENKIYNAMINFNFKSKKEARLVNVFKVDNKIWLSLLDGEKEWCHQYDIGTIYYDSLDVGNCETFFGHTLQKVENINIKNINEKIKNYWAEYEENLGL